MVAAEDGDSGRVSDLESYKEGNGLDGIVASVDVVACLGGQNSRSMLNRL